MTSKSQSWIGLHSQQIKTMVQEQNPTSVKELWTAINAWESFPSDRLNNLIVGMSRKCAAVIRARGGPTKYYNFLVVSFLPFWYNIG